jgi:uncharacterized protein (TIGR03790 family)
VPFAPRILGIVLLGLALALPAIAAPTLRDHLLVVFNRNEPESEALARHYAQVRGIPAERVIGLATSSLETISREEFNRTLRDPLLALLEQKNWTPRITRTITFPGGQAEVRQANGNQIWAIVLMRGIPLRIDADPTVPGPESLAPPFRVNNASVDSELALLTLQGHPIAGFIPNPYYSENRTREFTAFHADQLILVTRLDGPSFADARRLVDDAIATEALELGGRAVFDARGLRDPANGYTIGDEWIRQAEAHARAAGLTTVLDDAEPLFPETLPWDDIALYAGWYAGNATGPFIRPDFRFRPGAIAYHIHSFSAETIRTPNRNWVGPLIAHGAAATMGCVYEPYLRMTPHVGVFFRSLLDGVTFAEAAYQSQIALSWMTTVIGDPLYRPFPRPVLESLRLAEGRDGEASDWVVARMLRILAAQPGPAEERLATIERAAASRPTPVVMEQCATLFQELGAPPEKAILLLRQARQESTSPAARIRRGLAEAELLATAGRMDESMALYDSLLESDPAAAATYGVAAAGLKTATAQGWPRLPPNLQKHLTPVGTPNSGGR